MMASVSTLSYFSRTTEKIQPFMSLTTSGSAAIAKFTFYFN